MKLSIITPTRGNTNNLKNYFESLLNQNFVGEAEIILCTTAADTCKLPSFIKNKYSDRFHVRVLSTTELGIASARNLGLRSASGKYVFFLDDDCSLPDKNYLTTTIEKMEKSELTGWAGGYIISDRSLNFNSAFYNYISVLWLKSFMHSSRLFMILGGCCWFRRLDLLNCGAQFEDNNKKAGEEFLFAKTVTENNIAIFFSDELSVLHNPQCTIVSLLRKSWNHGKAIKHSSYNLNQNRWGSYIKFFHERPLQSLQFFPLLVLFLFFGRLAFVWRKVFDLVPTTHKPYLKRSYNG